MKIKMQSTGKNNNVLSCQFQQPLWSVTLCLAAPRSSPLHLPFSLPSHHCPLCHSHFELQSHVLSPQEVCRPVRHEQRASSGSLSVKTALRSACMPHTASRAAVVAAAAKQNCFANPTMGIWYLHATALPNLLLLKGLQTFKWHFQSRTRITGYIYIYIDNHFTLVML